MRSRTRRRTSLHNSPTCNLTMGHKPCRLTTTCNPCMLVRRALTAWTPPSPTLPNTDPNPGANTAANAEARGNAQPVAGNGAQVRRSGSSGGRRDTGGKILTEEEARATLKLLEESQQQQLQILHRQYDLTMEDVAAPATAQEHEANAEQEDGPLLRLTRDMREVHTMMRQQTGSVQAIASDMGRVKQVTDACGDLLAYLFQNAQKMKGIIDSLQVDWSTQKDKFSNLIHSGLRDAKAATASIASMRQLVVSLIMAQNDKAWPGWQQAKAAYEQLHVEGMPSAAELFGSIRDAAGTAQTAAMVDAWADEPMGEQDGDQEGQPEEDQTMLEQPADMRGSGGGAGQGSGGGHAEEQDAWWEAFTAALNAQGLMGYPNLGTNRWTITDSNTEQVLAKEVPGPAVREFSGTDRRLASVCEQQGCILFTNGSVFNTNTRRFDKHNALFCQAASHGTTTDPSSGGNTNTHPNTNRVSPEGGGNGTGAGGKQGIKMREPPKFSGEDPKYPLETALFKFEQYFRYNKAPPSDWAILASNLLSGQAMQHCSRIAQERQGDMSWEEFKAVLKDFAQPDRRTVALTKLLHIRQTAGVRDYIRFFKQTVAEAGETLESPSSIMRFWHGLKDREAFKVDPATSSFWSSFSTLEQHLLTHDLTMAALRTNNRTDKSPPAKFPRSKGAGPSGFGHRQGGGNNLGPVKAALKQAAMGRGRGGQGGGQGGGRGHVGGRGPGRSGGRHFDGASPSGSKENKEPFLPICNTCTTPEMRLQGKAVFHHRSQCPKANSG